MSFSPKYSIAHEVGRLKGISASEVFKEFLAVKKDMLVVGWQIFGGWVFCEEAGRQGDIGFDQVIH